MIMIMMTMTIIVLVGWAAVKSGAFAFGGSARELSLQKKGAGNESHSADPALPVGCACYTAKAPRFLSTGLRRHACSKSCPNPIRASGSPPPTARQRATGRSRRPVPRRCTGPVGART